MYLAELELQGFKSFAQKTHVTFGSGVTAIVGPNGCGKSNIVDALRWALGEQRPSLLRSTAMSNVIFNGTASRKAQGMAEVSVTIHNNKGILPLEFRDVTVTRRLFRNGDSEYLLNKVPCRLKDIVDLFMDTGMGANAYSVIELKMVEEILTDRNNDRRRLFEEAAGLTKYKERRKQTLRKLEETRTDLQRVDDLLVEIRKNVRSLQMQAGKAQRAKEYGEQLRHLDLALSRHEHRTILAELLPLMERIVHAEQEKEELTRMSAQLDEQYDLTKESLTAKEQDVVHAQRQVNRLHAAIQEAETAVRIATERIASEENVIRQFETDVTQSEDELKDWKRAQKRAEDQVAGAEAVVAEKDEAVRNARLVVEAMQADVNRVRESLEAATRQYQDVNLAISALQSKSVRLDARIEQMLDENQRLARQIENAQADADHFDEDEAALRYAFKQAVEAREAAEARRDDAVLERQRLADEQNALKDRMRAAQSKRETVAAEIALLDGLAASTDAVPESVAYLTRAGAEAPGITPLSDLFSTTPELAVALESALGEAVNWLVTDTVSQAKTAFGALRKASKGKAAILPMELVPASSPIHPDSIRHQVKVGKAYAKVADWLLGRVVLAADLDDAASKVKGGFSAVTADGDVIDSEIVYKGGSTHKNVGLRVGLKDRIETLRSSLDATDADVRRIGDELVDANTKLDRIRLDGYHQDVKTAEAAARDIENKLNALVTRKTLLTSSALDLRDRLRRNEETVKTARAEREQMRPEAERLQASADELIALQVKSRAEREKKEDARQKAQQVWNEHQLAAQQSRNQLENIRKDLERASVAIAGIHKRLEIRAANAKESKQRILEAQEQIRVSTSDLTRAKADKADADGALAEADEIAARYRGRLNQIETDLRDVRRRKEVNLELVHHLGMSKERYEMQAGAIADHVWETYGLLMEAVTEELPEDAEPGAVRETISTLRERLKNIGEVNALAIHEYEEENARLQLFEQQIADLNEAEQKLLATIDEINTTATNLFMNTFEQVRENFKTVFHTLFQENDDCDLKLDDSSDDPLERKINIIANPRGKRPSNIEQLSGGEKTLTAIALLFAIYLVKPSPFCILDEVDAPLDDANVDRFAGMIRRFSRDTQFIIITHNKKTMEHSEMLYGVTMPEVGISKLVAVKLD